MYQAYSLEMPACSILKPSQAGWKLCSFGGRGGTFSASGWCWTSFASTSQPSSNVRLSLLGLCCFPWDRVDGCLKALSGRLEFKPGLLGPDMLLPECHPTG